MCNCVIFSICSRPIHHIQFVNSVAVRLQKRSAHEWVFQLPLEYKYRVALQRGEDERHTIVIDLKHLWLKLFSEAALPVFHDKKISQNDTKCQFPLRLAKNSSKVQVATMHVTNCTIIALFRSHFRFSSIDYPEYTMSMCPKTWELRQKLFFKSDNVCLMVSSNH